MDYPARMVPTRPSARVHEILARSGGGGADALERPARRHILGRVLAMGLPSVASFLLLTIYDLTNMFWLARLGEELVAAVTVFAAFIAVMSFPNQLIGTGSVAVISRRFGEGDARGTEVAIKNTFLGKFVVGGIMGALAIPILRPSLELLGASPEVTELGVAYGWIQCAGLGMSLASFSVYTALRGIGRPTFGMWTSLVGAVINLVLDPLLIFGIGPFPRMGIAGAAISSMAGFTTVTIVGMTALSGPGSPVRVRWFAPPWPDLGESVRMMRIGLPSALAGLSFALLSSVIVKLVAVFGTTAVALFGASQKIVRFGGMLLGGLGLGTSALIGQYLGSRELHKAWLAAVINARLASWSMILFAAAVSLFAPALIGFFLDDAALAPEGAVYLRILAIGLPFFGLTLAAEQAYAGAGRNTPAFLMHVTIGWGLIVPLMLLFGRVLHLGPAGMLAGHSLGQAAGALLSVQLLRRGSWLEHSI
jgi:putative MATE family efflux protein